MFRRVEPGVYAKAYMESVCLLGFHLGCLGSDLLVEREEFLEFKHSSELLMELEEASEFEKHC